MKYLFAAILVVTALVTVFNLEAVIPIPRALGSLMNTAVAKHMPFEVQEAYARSCVAGLESDQDRVRYAVSDTSVRVAALDSQIAELQTVVSGSADRIGEMVAEPNDVSQDAVAREVSRHDNLQWKLTHTKALRDRVAETLDSLESAEHQTSQGLEHMTRRLDVVRLDHECNDALSLAAEFAHSSYPGRRIPASHCNKVLDHMEHSERVREELHRRYAAIQGDDVASSVANPWERARQVAEGRN